MNSIKRLLKIDLNSKDSIQRGWSVAIISGIAMVGVAILLAIVTAILPAGFMAGIHDWIITNLGAK